MLSSPPHSFCCAPTHPRTSSFRATRKSLSKARTTSAVNLVHLKLPLVVALVRKSQKALPILQTVLVLALVDLPVWPNLPPHPVLLITQPIAGVAGSVDMCIGSFPTGLIVQPLTVIDVPIAMVKRAHSVGLIILPLPRVSRTISPNLLPFAVALPVQPLSLVGNSVIQRYLAHFHSADCGDNLPNHLIVLSGFSTTDEVFARLFLPLGHH